jgi:hypothetical protein
MNEEQKRFLERAIAKADSLQRNLDRVNGILDSLVAVLEMTSQHDIRSILIKRKLTEVAFWGPAVPSVQWVFDDLPTLGDIADSAKGVDHLRVWVKRQHRHVPSVRLRELKSTFDMRTPTLSLIIRL